MDFYIMNIIFCVLKYLFFLSSICVLLNVQTIYTVFSLILAFISAAFLFILAGATFIGFILVVVYIGAVLVFFLFVVMMLNLRSELQFDFTLFYCLCAIVSFLLINEIVLIYPTSADDIEIRFIDFNFNRTLDSQPNILVIGYLLYTWYVFPLIICSLILLVAMIGAIVLLVDQSKLISAANTVELPRIYSQNISDQVSVQEFEVLKLIGKVKVNYIY